jgi:hypothetical protein
MLDVLSGHADVVGYLVDLIALLGAGEDYCAASGEWRYRSSRNRSMGFSRRELMKVTGVSAQRSISSASAEASGM